MESKDFNPRTIVAIGLSLLIFILWQQRIAKKQTEYNKYVETVQDRSSDQQTSEIKKYIKSSENQINDNANEKSNLPSSIMEKDFEYENRLFKVIFTNKNAAVKQFIIKNYKEKNNNINFLSDISVFNSYSIKYDNKDRFFELVRKENNKITFSDGKVEKSYEFYKDNFYFKITEKRIDKNLKPFLYMVLDNKELKTSILKPQALSEINTLIYNSNGSIKGIDFAKIGKEKEEKREDIIVRWISLGNKYFTSSLILPDNKNGRLDFNEIVESNAIGNTSKNILAKIELPGNEQIEVFGFIGPKEMHFLKEVNSVAGQNLKFENNKIYDYGWFSFLAIPLLKLLKFLYSIVSNWGLAIIILTIIVKLILYPLTTKSLKAMKDMQKIQPEMKKIKEKYKDDKEMQNKETMLLMKRHKVNPMGSCLPMLLQLPVFLALYKVFGVSVELYKSPFIFWITDLSVMDKYWVLPILMGLAMVLQQKMTPTTGDPMQAKIMMFMPVMFTFIMISLPSGLTLYFFVNTLFSILQQLYIQRAVVDDKKETVKKNAKLIV